MEMERAWGSAGSIMLFVGGDIMGWGRMVIFKLIAYICHLVTGRFRTIYPNSLCLSFLSCKTGATTACD